MCQSRRLCLLWYRLSEPDEQLSRRCDDCFSNSGDTWYGYCYCHCPDDDYHCSSSHNFRRSGWRWRRKGSFRRRSWSPSRSRRRYLSRRRNSDILRCSSHRHRHRHSLWRRITECRRCSPPLTRQEQDTREHCTRSATGSHQLLESLDGWGRDDVLYYISVHARHTFDSPCKIMLAMQSFMSCYVPASERSVHSSRGYECV
jgi:hypothetical protein